MTAPPALFLLHDMDPDMPHRLRYRRIVFALLVAASCAAMLGLMAWTLGDGGLDMADCLMLAAFAATLPWSTIGFWNAVIGLVLMRAARDPLAVAAPAALLGSGDTPITARTAILVCIRNEDTARLQAKLDAMIAGLAATGAAAKLELFLLSDSDRPAIVAAEQTLALRL
jgi:membrane glycosyltransferase